MPRPLQTTCVPVLLLRMSISSTSATQRQYARNLLICCSQRPKGCMTFHATADWPMFFALHLRFDMAPHAQSVELISQPFFQSPVGHVAVHATAVAGFVGEVVMTTDAVQAAVVDVIERHRQYRFRAAPIAGGFRLLCRKRRAQCQEKCDERCDKNQAQLHDQRFRTSAKAAVATRVKPRNCRLAQAFRSLLRAMNLGAKQAAAAIASMGAH